VLNADAKMLYTINRDRCLAMYAKDAAQGVTALRQLLQQFPVFAEASYLLAQALKETGDIEGALTFATKAVSLDAKTKDFSLFLAELYVELHLNELAIPLLRKSATPDDSHAQALLAKCLSEAGLSTEALRHYQLAIKTDKNNDALKYALAATADTANKKDIAQPVFESLARKKSKHSAYALARLALLTKDTFNSAIGRQIDHLLGSASSTDADKAVLLLSKGKLFERQQDFDNAFRSWTAAREFSKRRNWALRDQNETYANMAGFYSRDVLNCTAKEKPLDTTLVILAGMPRSGTTLTEQILASHSRSAGAGEFGRWGRLELFFRDQFKTDPTQFDTMASVAAGLAAETIDILHGITNKPSDYIIEKLPHNFKFLGFQRILYPNAKFIHIRRNPFDCFLSSYQGNLSKWHGYAFDQVEYAKEYLFHEKMMDYWKAHFPDQIYTFNYEELALNPEKKARELIEFVGLEWEDQCLEFYKSDRAIRTLSKQQVRNPVYTSSIGKWRNYEKHLGPLKQALADANFNYPDFG
jgi:tetratricopeptide (TPR) repeat protein